MTDLAHRWRPGRRRVLRALLGAGIGIGLVPLWPRRAAAEDPEVPIDTQMKLLAKVAQYDRNAQVRFGGTCSVLILSRRDHARSGRIAAKIRTDIAALGTIAGATIETHDLDFSDAAGLARTCADKRIGVLIITPGLSSDIAAIADALDGTDLLSVSVLARDVSQGVVLGFALESSRPQIWINLGRAKRQNVDFSSRLLALAKVVDQ